ncbi:phosphonoacetaldehyde reductase [Acutalibacter caecimuris]|uniref:phosphonoacetaldehyde reductase n=1 Tax=Acutalibacter caecimuris TaxID=3093657 RepID=UPI002AC96BB3|nr:phosphonoacetaldehyde reductase [Acutalibacter sp. M00118]
MRQTIVKDLKYIRSYIETKKFFLVHDSAYNNLKIKAFFDEFSHVDFCGFTSNPLYEQACKGVELFNKSKCELIVAVGGGSTIDVAKCIKLYCRMDSSVNYFNQENFDSGVTLIAIPTTAGSGSESTSHAVIYYEGLKQSISHASILPNCAVLEPSVLDTLPIYQKKCTMLDALCQAIESWWSLNSTDKSRGYARKAILTIKENWEDYIFGNSNSVAEKILDAANYAGRAINITATTSAHAMSYMITSIYKIPHGHAVALCMREVWNYTLNHMNACIDRRGEKYFKDTLDHIATIIDLSYYTSMICKMGMNNPKSINRDAELDILVRLVNPERLRNNPISFSNEAIRDMYLRIVD